VPDYWYQALSGSGAVEEGWISAASEIVVEEQLRRKGAFLIKAEARSRAKKVTDATVDRKERSQPAFRCSPFSTTSNDVSVRANSEQSSPKSDSPSRTRARVCRTRWRNIPRHFRRFT